MLYIIFRLENKESIITTTDSHYFLNFVKLNFFLHVR